jgi:hypothetical protein
MHVADHRIRALPAVALLVALTGCDEPACDRDDNFCDDNRVVRCEDGEVKEIGDCDIFELQCVETVRLEDDLPFALCVLSAEPCAEDEGSFCFGERIGTCGITEYPVCAAEQYSMDWIGDASDCINCQEHGQICAMVDGGAGCVDG